MLRACAQFLHTISTCLIWWTFLNWVISVYICSSKETKKDKKGSKYQDIKNDLAAAIVQIRRSEELNKKREREYQETLAAMQRRIQELEGRNPFSFIEFHNVNEMSPIWEPFFWGGKGGVCYYRVCYYQVENVCSS